MTDIDELMAERDALRVRVLELEGDVAMAEAHAAKFDGYDPEGLKEIDAWADGLLIEKEHLTRKVRRLRRTLSDCVPWLNGMHEMLAGISAPDRAHASSCLDQLRRVEAILDEKDET